MTLRMCAWAIIEEAHDILPGPRVRDAYAVLDTMHGTKVLGLKVGLWNLDVFNLCVNTTSPINKQCLLSFNKTQH